MSNYAGFTSIPVKAPKKSRFDLSHQKRLSCRMGLLVPTMVIETLPGDLFSGSCQVLTRVAPLLSPVYETLTVYFHTFYQAYRNIWEDWEEFIWGGRLGVGIDPVTAPVPPYFSLGLSLDAEPAQFMKSSLSDYLGVPVLPIFPSIATDYNNVEMQLIPYAVYQSIWYEYYRDRNFVADSVFDFPLASGIFSDVATSPFLQIRQRHYIKDYYTSALPFTQRGAEVLIPFESMVDTVIQNTTGVPPVAAGDLMYDNVGQLTGAGPIDVHLVGDNATASINDLRMAFALQIWSEQLAVAGSRPHEASVIMFGVRPQDYRLNRPEYIGGYADVIKISEVLTTANSENADTEVIPVGNMSGHGKVFSFSGKWRYFCHEHGMIMTIMSIMNEPSYHQGMPRMFFDRETFLAYPYPALAKLGEQPVYKGELYAIHQNLIRDVTSGEFILFGYQSRYADWKFIPNTSHGDFHDTLLFWTLTRQFISNPTLGETFVQFEGNSQDRLFAVNSGEDYFWMFIQNSVQVVRALPYFGTPNTMGFV